ncbi:RAD52 motif-containing protein 1 isoform X3 [Sander lucioperca]|uniref:RAD52 motif-containing protein 1 isoform X3 n=1 Tax=Sander lucioperca TaxID=283035 RepID=UPI00125E09EE|nr:RAD52 motif-containing protein 1 isoform X3 [Sander lucioperca]
MEVDVLEFKVPVENNKTLFVWNIQPSHTEAQIYAELYAVFSSFGPLYLLKVCPNAPLNPPGFYALVKFYSAAQAAQAQRQTDGRPLLHSAPLKVRLSSKNTPHFLVDRSRPLSHACCLELANHCLGFNGWTSDIITLKELPTEEEEEEEEEEEGGGRRRSLRFGCLLQLSFPHHGQTSRAAAVLEDSFTCTGNGKVMVELKQTSDQFLPEETEGVLQVNEVSWSEIAPDEDEADDEEWELTVS